MKNGSARPRKLLAVDFDGVIHRYSRGWHDSSIYDPPMKGALVALRTLRRTFKIVVFSRRAAHQGTKKIKQWLHKHKIPFDAVTKVKPRARWYIDDRAIHFTTWTKTLKEIARLEKKYPFRNRK
ncbi:MAG: hypothetical protein HYT13_00535 [Candidatus Liptonbacteria bacterium]|nr:hypothetical protein [Candidatus Liptonbacteria bacterium]